MTSQSALSAETEAPHYHEWEAPGAWGVIVGVSRCRACGKVSERSDFPTLNAGASPSTAEETRHAD